MKIRILSWNVRGLNSRERRRRIRSSLKKWRVDIVALQESKIECMSREMVRDLWPGNFIDWVSLEARGTAGGIIMLWDRRVVSKIDETKGVFSISCFFKNVVDGFEWVLSGVYGPNEDSLRGSLWAELEEVKIKWVDPWCITGDFNVVRAPNEKKG